MYKAKENRYEQMVYNRCGKSGLKLPALSLGLWHNFGDVDVFENYQKTARAAFDLGVTHFDLANNYGPPPGSAEENFGKLLKKDFKPYRDELIISTKAGYRMGPGPYGDWGSKKYLISSLDQSLKRMGIDYVDIFYHHRPDPDTPLEETIGALQTAVQQGKALYAGISNYNPQQTQKAAEISASLHLHLLIHQVRYSMFDRSVEAGLLNVLQENGMGAIVFSPLAQGLLTNRYLDGIPSGSRAARTSSPFLNAGDIDKKTVTTIKKLNKIARNRNQSLAQMAIAWLLKDSRINSVLVGASSANQLKDNVASLNNRDFSEEELTKIESVLKEYNM